MRGARRTVSNLSWSCRGSTNVCAIFVAALMLSSLVGCSRSPPEDRLRARVAAMQEALETGRPSDFVAGIAEDFTGESGLDREGVRNLLRVQVLRNERIGASLGPMTVEMHGERATVTFTALLTGGRGGLLPDNARAWSVRSGWRDGPDDWQMIHAEWKPAL